MLTRSPSWGHFDPRSMNSRIYVELLLTLLHAERSSLWFQKRRFSSISHYKPMADNDVPGSGPKENKRIDVPATEAKGEVRYL